MEYPGDPSLSMSRLSNEIRILYTLTSFATLPTLVEAVEADRGAIDGLSIEDRAAVSVLQVLVGSPLLCARKE